MGFVGAAIGALGAGIGAALGGGAIAGVIGTIAASAIVGAAIGALTSLVLGGDIGTGALYGALGGAVMGSVSAATGGALHTATQAGMRSASGAVGPAAIPSSTPVATTGIGGIGQAMKTGYSAYNAASVPVGPGGAGGTGTVSPVTGMVAGQVVSGIGQGLLQKGMMEDKTAAERELWRDKMNVESANLEKQLRSQEDIAAARNKEMLESTRMQIENQQRLQQAGFAEEAKNRQAYSSSVSGINQEGLASRSSVAASWTPEWLKPVMQNQNPQNIQGAQS